MFKDGSPQRKGKNYNKTEVFQTAWETNGKEKGPEGG